MKVTKCPPAFAFGYDNPANVVGGYLIETRGFDPDYVRGYKKYAASVRLGEAIDLQKKEEK